MGIIILHISSFSNFSPSAPAPTNWGGDVPASAPPPWQSKPKPLFPVASREEPAAPPSSQGHGVSEDYPEQGGKEGKCYGTIRSKGGKKVNGVGENEQSR